MQMRENTGNPCMKNLKPFERVILLVLLKVFLESFYFNGWVILLSNKVSSETFFNSLLHTPFFYMRILFIRITRFKIVKNWEYPKNHGKAQIYDKKLRKSHLDPPSRVGLIHNGMFSICNGIYYEIFLFFFISLFCLVFYA